MMMDTIYALPADYVIERSLDGRNWKRMYGVFESSGQAIDAIRVWKKLVKDDPYEWRIYDVRQDREVLNWETWIPKD